MIKEAEQHAEEDRRIQEAIAARNELDTLAYRAEQLIRDLGDRAPVHEKARAEQLIADARQAIEEQADVDRVRPLISDLQQVLQSLPAAAAQAEPAGQAGQGGPGAQGGTQESGDEEVVDAEFTRE
jgi:molecular chaperone DnaK